MSSLRALVCVVLGLAPSACFNPVDAPSAYAGERDLCSDEARDELARRVADCRARWREEPGDCAGVISFVGMLQGVDVVVDAELEGTEVQDLRIGSVVQRNGFKVKGRSPYFRFEFGAKLLGGAPDVGDVERRFELTPGVAPELRWYEDDRSEVELGLEAGTSGDIQLVQGQLVLERQTPDEQVGRFTGESARGDTVISGCFHAFTTETRLGIEEP